MITKETAKDIYNCYQQLEEIGKIKADMVEEIERAREQSEKESRLISGNDSLFGKYDKGMQLGIPNGFNSSMRIFGISPTIGLLVMEEQEKVLKNKLDELKAIAKIELCINNFKE